MRPTIEQAAREWVAHSKAMGLADGTVKARQDAVTPLVRMYGTQTVASLRHDHLDRLFARQTWGPATRNARLGAYRSFFAWCRARGFMPLHNDPLFGWRYLKKPPIEQLRVPVQEWARLFHHCATPIETIVVATGLYLFLRASEQRYLQVKHFDLNNNTVDVFRVKTRTRDTMPIPAELRAHLVPYLTWYSEQVPMSGDHYLIPAKTKAKSVGQRFQKGSGELVPTKPLDRIHLTVQAVLARGGYPTFQQGEHTLRRSGARAYFDELLNNGYDGAMRRVQTMLGHEHSSTTEGYLGLTVDKATRNVELAGKPMFPSLTHTATVIPIRQEM